MAAVSIDSGELPSAEGVPEGHELAQVVGKWQSIAHGRFRDDCRFLLQMINETDRLRLWEKNVGGFTFATRDEFLQRKVLIDYDLTEKQTRQIVEALKSGRSGGIAELVAKTKPATTHGGAREGAGRPAKDGDDKSNPNLGLEKKGKRKRSNSAADPERVISYLKRDKADEAQPAEVRQKAGFLLAGIERGEVKPHGAAKAMGYVKPKPRISIPTDTPESAIKALTRVFTLEQIIEAEPLRGLGASISDVERLLGGDDEALEALRAELVAKHGGERDGAGRPSQTKEIKTNNVSFDYGLEPDLFTQPQPDPEPPPRPKRQTEHGNRKDYTLSRLKKDEPALFDASSASVGRGRYHVPITLAAGNCPGRWDDSSRRHCPAGPGQRYQISR